MTPTRLFRAFFLACFALGSAPFAHAELVELTPTFSASNQAAPPDTTDYEGIFYDFSSTFPPSSIPIGTFSFTAIPPGDHIASATISGTFGDVNYGTTALTDLYAGGIEVAECDAPGGVYPDCAVGTVDGSLVPWSYTFTDGSLTALAAELAAGLDFTAVQNGFGSVVVGTPTLSLVLTPEPGSIVLLASALALAAFRIRK